MYFYDFPEARLKSEVTPQQAFLLQLMRPLAQSVANIEFLLLQTRLGNAFLEVGVNPYLVFLRRYFREAYPQVRRQIEGFADLLEKKTAITYFGIGHAQPLDKFNYSAQRDFTVSSALLRRGI
jgi:hypothetical protein